MGREGQWINQPINEPVNISNWKKDDEFGIYPTCVIKIDDIFYLYYTGWTRGVSTFAMASIGIATSTDGETFTRKGKGPIMTQTLNEAFVLSGPKVRVFDNKLHMWYLAVNKWVMHNGRPEELYTIRHATSENGIDWKRDEIDIIPSILDDECQAGPDVFYHNGVYHMYFSYRYGLDFRNAERGYRIGYAKSTDLINWVRAEEGISLSKTGWDSEMMHYPHVFCLDDKYYMLYNGNDFGRFGFGIAILENI